MVDAGPDPDAVDGCLDAAGIVAVPAVILTHFHADHVRGLSGVLRGRSVASVLATPIREPVEEAAAVDDVLAGTGIRVEEVTAGDARTAGAVGWRAIWPRRRIAAGSVPNNASLVLVLTVDGRTVLLSGDIEPEAQAAVAVDLQDAHFDVVKVPHHGSRYQSPLLTTWAPAPIALISVGADNDYGHPAPETIECLDRDRRTGGADGPRRRRGRGVCGGRARGGHSVLSLTHEPPPVLLPSWSWCWPPRCGPRRSRLRTTRRPSRCPPSSRPRLPSSRPTPAVEPTTPPSSRPRRPSSPPRRHPLPRSPSPATPCPCASTTADRSSPPPRSDCMWLGYRLSENSQDKDLFGITMRRAVTAFQGKNWLPVTGRIDQRTWRDPADAWRSRSGPCPAGARRWRGPSASTSRLGSCGTSSTGRCG